MSDKMEIDGEYFDIEEEELNNIEYLEIISIDEIIKNNISFMALSEDEIQVELYKMFKNKNKTDNFTKLFYDVIKNNRINEGKLDDYSNYILMADANKKKYDDVDVEEEVTKFNNFARSNIQKNIIDKNKYFNAIEYDEDSDSKTFKPTSKTILDLNDRSYYPIFPIDDVQIPIIASYYKVPVSTVNDYMYLKVLSHLFNNKNINKKLNKYDSIDNLIKNTKPSIKTVINDIPDCFELDYNNLNNILNRYGHSMEFINKDDFNLLHEHMTKLVKNDKERKNVYKPIKNKKINIINNKLTFFDIFSKTMSLVKLNDKTKELLQNLKIALDDKRINSNLLQKPNLLYDNIDDIVKNSNSDVDLEQIISNIKNVKDFKNIDNNIDTIKNLLETNIEEIIEELENIKSDFDNAKYNIKNYDDNINEKNFINFYNEMKEIELGNNDDDYEGIAPNILIGFDNFEELQFDYENVEVEKNTGNINLEKYWLKFKNDVGFIELIKITLPIINKISTSSGIDIDYDILCNELHNHYGGESTKYNLLKDALDDLDDETIKNIAKIKANSINSIDLGMGADINNIIKNILRGYNDKIKDVLYSYMAWWILDIQSKIINEDFNIDVNILNKTHIEKWDLYGEPLQKEKNVIGVAPYLINIAIDIIEDNEYNINITYNDIINLINDRYGDTLTALKQTYGEKDSKKRVEYGKIARDNLIDKIKKQQFNKISNDFIEALLYSPDVNYKKIHKYLLGCCLQKLTKDFKPDSDLKNVLIQVKKKFAENKVTNKARSIRYIPVLAIKDNEYEDEIEYMQITETSIKIKEENVEKWLDNMRGKIPLLPDEIIDEFKVNTRSAIKYIETYIDLVGKTSKKYTKEKELKELFVPSKINYKTLLLNIIKVLSVKTEDGDTDLLLKSAIKSIREIMIDLDSLNRVKTDDNSIDIERISVYVVARALCLPCNPENNSNGILTPMIEVKTNFIEENAAKLYSRILSSIKNSKFLSFEENTAFINTMREKNKDVKLSILNDKSVEVNNLISALKKAGIKNNLMSVEKVVELQKQQYDNDEKEDDEEGENEYAMAEDEDNRDEDVLDKDDMGFIYAD